MGDCANLPVIPLDNHAGPIGRRYRPLIGHASGPRHAVPDLQKLRLVAGHDICGSVASTAREHTPTERLNLPSFVTVRTTV